MTFASNATQVPQKTAQPKHRLPLVVGLSLAAIFSLGLWTGLDLGVRSFFSLFS
jgi:hypothetical protein